MSKVPVRVSSESTVGWGRLSQGSAAADCCGAGDEDDGDGGDCGDGDCDDRQGCDDDTHDVTSSL